MNPDDAPAARGDFEVGAVVECGTVGEAGAVCGRGGCGCGRGRFRRAVDLDVRMGTGAAREEGCT